MSSKVDKVEIVEYSPELKQYFYDINHQWVDSMFVVEEVDEQMLSNPQKYVLDPGGYIWFARHPDHGVVGTCALMKVDEGVYELTKMGVFESARGLKVGEKLLKHVLEFSVAKKHESLFLLTNKKCEAAIHLYEKLGFEHSEEIMSRYALKYERCDVAMKFVGNSL